MNEPLWKLVLNWGVVVTFLTLPLVIMVIQLYLLSHPDVIPNAEQHEDSFRHLTEFHRDLAFLVFGLAGLRSWEVIKANGSSNNKPLPSTENPPPLYTKD